MAQQRIIVDVTQLVHWPGKLTGIPRVMNELALRFEQEHNPDILFASWVKELGQLCEIDFVATMRQRGNGIAYLKPGETRTLTYEAVATATVGQSTPTTTRRITPKRVAKYGLRKLGKLSPRIASGIERRSKQMVLRGHKQIVFQKDDILFIPWGEWWDQSYIARLEALHASGVKLAPVIHDIGPMLVPELSGHSTDSLTAYCQRVVPISAVTLVVSHYTKKQLAQWLKDQKLHVPRIEVFRNGDDFAFSKSEKPADPLFKASGLKGGDYIMCGAGTVELKKNHLLLYYAYKLAQARGITLPKLVVVGRIGWKGELFYDLVTKDLTMNKQILPLLNINDEELSWLYDHCMFSVWASIDEGWGIPIAESLARGVPCACSNTSSMVEIAEGIVQHFSPFSTDECLAAIQKWLDPKELAKATKLAKTYKQTSWDDSYKQVKTYLEGL